MPSSKKITAALVLFCITCHVRAQPFYQVGAGVGPVARPILSLYADSVNNILYAGGWFLTAGNVQAICTATWDGTGWDSTRNQAFDPSGDQVRSIAKFNNEIYVAGPFGFYDTAGNVTMHSVAKWDSASSAWINFGINQWGAMYGLYTDNIDLYISGNFDSINGVYSSKIIRYDGTNWYSFPPLDTAGSGGVGGGNVVGSVIMYNGELYVGGNYGSIPATNKSDLARFDGTQWLPVGNGLSGANTGVGDFAIYQGKLIVSGNFQTAWGDPGNAVAAWDGTQWSQLGSGMNSGGASVLALAVYNGELWAGGAFSIAGGIPVTNLAKWDGTQWYSLGITLDNVVTSLAVLGNDLYIGGAFWTMNGDSVHKIIRYNYLTGFEEITPKNEIEIYPNPTTGIINVKNFNSHKLKNIFVYNTLGEKAKSLKAERSVFMGDLPKGLYLVQLRNDSGIVYTQKIILE